MCINAVAYLMFTAYFTCICMKWHWLLLKFCLILLRMDIFMIVMIRFVWGDNKQGSSRRILMNFSIVLGIAKRQLWKRFTGGWTRTDWESSAKPEVSDVMCWKHRWTSSQSPQMCDRYHLLFIFGQYPFLLHLNAFPYAFRRSCRDTDSYLCVCA